MNRRSPPPDVEAYDLMRAGRLADALQFAERAVAGQLLCLPAHAMLATILLKLGRPTDAERVVVEALHCQPGVPDAYDGLAHVSLLLGQHERSNALYRRVVEMAPSTARYWYNFASSERSFGRLIEAEDACNRAIALDPTCHGTYLLRSELRVQSPQDNHVAELKLKLAAPSMGELGRVPLGYALAKELDDLRRFDEAFLWFANAATVRRRLLTYDVAVDEAKLRRIQEVFTKDLVRDAAPAQRSGRYIFIVGLPRSGTTLLEHILTGLSHVRSNGETDNFSSALIAATPAGSGDVFERTTRADSMVVAANYARLAVGSSSTEFIIEKLPMNYLYLGAIRRALPQSKIVLVRRSPLDSCFAMYRTLFGAAYPFSYDFEDLARYYAAFDRLMAHWRESLGDSLFEIAYEDLVKDPSQWGAAVAKHCDFEWDVQALEIQRSSSVSFTASAAQIRRPIYGSSSGRWRHYRRHLDPLIGALRRHGIPTPLDV